MNLTTNHGAQYLPHVLDRLLSRQQGTARPLDKARIHDVSDRAHGSRPKKEPEKRVAFPGKRQPAPRPKQPAGARWGARVGHPHGSAAALHRQRPAASTFSITSFPITWSRITSIRRLRSGLDCTRQRWRCKPSSALRCRWRLPT